MGQYSFCPFYLILQNFKGRFFKLFIEPEGKPYSYIVDGKLKFPFYGLGFPFGMSLGRGHL